MIPKIIHYCWFGGNLLPKDAERYIESWKKYCPDYEIKEWNESNFDLNMYPYVREAYDNKKFAFVSDVARLYAMYTEGGIYMDTDVEVLKPLDDLLKYDGVSGFEYSSNIIQTGLLASRKLHPFIKEWLEEYKNIHFIKDDGSLDMTPNTNRITELCLKNGFIADGKMQTFKDFTFFPSDYFCPKNAKTGIIELTNNSYIIHHFTTTWLEDRWMKIRNYNYQLHERKIPAFLRKMLYYAYYIVIAFQYHGFIKGIKKGFNVLLNKIKSHS